MGSPKHPRSPGAVLKRSFSTPDTAELERDSTEEAQSQHTAAAEKKRNKLGYHRTSIACSHCRRRKIRCIASPETPNRCVNCIRLKKECSFYPVDQQMGPESRPKAASRQTGGGDPSASSTSSSPAVGTGSPVDTPIATVNGIISTSGSHRGYAEYFSDASVSPNGVSTGSQYTFTNPPPGWVPTEMNAVGVAKPEEISMPWHAYPTGPSVNGQFSPYTQTSSASVAWTSGTSEAGSHDEMAWGDFPSSIRSLSYSGESTDGHPQGPFVSMHQAHQVQPYERRQSGLSDVYPPYPTTVAGMPSQSMAAVSGGPSQVIHGAPFTSGVNPWQQQQQQQQQQMLAAQVQHATWQYGGVPNGSQPMLMDEQRMSGVTQAPSGVYYST
ncbi:hypothetical protein EsDP_00001390 [Epichloe bromicola]|uniref:Zn(2)-C6 fungal-type domain-containing protein n=1 Tax=Epichloe bromicola TaxID=79588 RepID=A0ABQ0CHQ3_9HYPO